MGEALEGPVAAKHRQAIMGDLPTGHEARKIEGCIVLGNMCRQPRQGAERSKNIGPIALTETQVGPSLFEGVGPNILEMNGDDPPCIGRQPPDGILAGTQYPAHIHLPIHPRRGFQKDIDRRASVWQGDEFEIVIVPSEPEAQRAELALDKIEALAEVSPAIRTRWPFTLGQPWRDHSIDAEVLGQIDDATELILQHFQRNMSLRHRQSAQIEFFPESGRILEVQPAALYAVVSSRGYPVERLGLG
ncbi:hypothetical protein D9M72_495680 [compost metagenome]